MKSRGGDRPDEGPDERRDPRAKTRRWGRGRAAEPEPEEPVAGEEFGWIDDLRSAKQQRTELGPDGAPAEPNRPRGGMPPADPTGPPAPAAPRTPAEPAGPRGGGPESAAPPAARPGEPGGVGARRQVDGPWPGEAPPPGRRPDDRPPAAGPGVAGQPPRRGVQPVPGARAAVPPPPPAVRPGGSDPVGPQGPRPAPDAPGGPARPRGAAAPPGPPAGLPPVGPPAGRRPDTAASPVRRPDGAVAPGRHQDAAPGGHPDVMPQVRRPDAGPPVRRPGPEQPAEPGRARPPADGTPAGRRAAGPPPDQAPAVAAPGSTRFDGAPAGVVPPPSADGLRPDPAIDRDPRTARRRPGPADPGAPEPTGRRAANPRAAAGGRRRAAEPDEPVVPRSGNAPAVPRSGNASSVPEATGAHSGALPTAGPADGTGRRRVVSDEQDRRTEPERRTPPGGEPRLGRPDRPERPADWLRQAGRLPHTDPGLQVVNRRDGGPPSGGRRPVPPTGSADLTDTASGRLAVPDPAAEGPSVRRPAGPPVDPGADAPTGRRAVRPDGSGSTGEQALPYPPTPTERPARGRGAAAVPPPDPTGRRGRAVVGPGPDAAARGAARSAPPGRARPIPGDAPAPGTGRGGADGPLRPGPGAEAAPRDTTRPDGPPRAAVPPGVDAPPRSRPDGPARAAVRPPGAPPPTDDRMAGEPGPAVPARGAVPTGRPAPTDRAAGRALPPHREPGRAEPSGVAPVPPPGRAGEPVGVARAAVVVPSASGPVDRPAPEPSDGPALRSAGQDAPDDDAAPGARSEEHRQTRERRRLRAAALVLVSVVLLGAVPLFFGLRTLSRDPVFDNLDQLSVPGWAAAKTVDDVSGSRWCLLDCRLRERTVTSEKAPKETAQVYEDALRQDGWRPWKVDRCPEQQTKGSYTCWRRDELTLDLWVREPTCVPPPVDGEPAVVPSADPSAAATECTGSLVSVKVRNAIDDERTRPQPTTDPSLTGEDPFPTVSADPLGELTSSPS